MDEIEREYYIREPARIDPRGFTEKDHDRMSAQAALYTELMGRMGTMSDGPVVAYPGPPCRSTLAGLGCGHGTLEHTQGTSPNQGCCCCTGRANDGVHVQDCRQCQIRWGQAKDTPSQEEIAEVAGVGTDEVQELLEQIQATALERMQQISERITPVRLPLNRAARRRVQGKGGRNAGAFGVKPNRKRHR